MFIIFASFASISQTQTVSAERIKYCGSGITEYFVPDAAFGCNFSKACQAHDACYAKCNEGQPMYGTPYCALSEFSPERLLSKRKCDNQLAVEIKLQNNNSFLCNRLADSYQAAVLILGQGPFNGREIPQEQFRDIFINSKTPQDFEARLLVMNQLSLDKSIDLLKLKGSKGVLTVPVTNSAIKSQLIKDGMLSISSNEKDVRIIDLLKK